MRNRPPRPRRSPAEIRALGRTAVAIQADAGSPDATRRPRSNRPSADLGGLDILVNNAGVLIAGPFSEQSLEEMNLQLNVNVRGVFVATQACA